MKNQRPLFYNQAIKIPVDGKLQSINEVNIISEVNGVFYGDNFKSGITFI